MYQGEQQQQHKKRLYPHFPDVVAVFVLGTMATKTVLASYSSSPRRRFLLIMLTCFTLAYVTIQRWPKVPQRIIVVPPPPAPLPSQEIVSNNVDYKQLQTIFHSGLANFTDVSKVQVPNPWLTDIDKEILLDGHLEDITKVASPDTSRLHVILPFPSDPLAVEDHVTLSPRPPLDVRDQATNGTERYLVFNSNGSSSQGGLRHNVTSSSLAEKDHVTPAPARSLAVGDNVTVRVDLKDAAGRPVTKGGASVRVWAVREKKPTCKEKTTDDCHWLAMAGHVTDLRNGSYTASLPVLWGGKFKIKAALVRPREFRRVILQLLDSMKLIIQVVSKFQSGQRSEVTPCSFLPIIPGFSAVCNLTSRNSGLPWYCGKPKKQPLSCADWKLSSGTSFPTRYPGLSPAEDKLMQRFSEKTRALFPLKETVTLTTVPVDKHPPTTNKTCHNTSPRDTWMDQSPRGYWDNGQWRPLPSGCDLPPLTASLLCSCLGNTTVLIMGDSNARQVFEVLSSATKCRRNYTSSVPLSPLYVACPCGLHVFWNPHAYPFFSGNSRSWTTTRDKHPPSYHIDRVPSTGSYVIVIHLYAHFAPVHTATYGLQVRDTARAVRDLVKRNPKVKVFLRGPHAYGGNTFRLAGDYHAERCNRVLRHEFRALRDHVFFLDVWDMTVANENCDIHPGPAAKMAVTRMMLSHMCSPEGHRST